MLAYAQLLRRISPLNRTRIRFDWGAHAARPVSERNTGVLFCRERAGSEACATANAGILSYFACRDAITRLFQKEIHAIEIDDGMTDVQRVHP